MFVGAFEQKMSDTANGRDVDDCEFLEQVLDKLYDFGPATKNKLKSQKKKRRERCEEEDVLPADSSCIDNGEEDDEDLDTAHQHQSKRDKVSQQTGSVFSSRPPICQRTQVEVVTFQDPSKKLTKQIAAPVTTPSHLRPLQITEKKQSDSLEELNLEKARLEVHRFGITGYKKEQQRVFEQDRAVMLGARPPKKAYVNYKVLQQQIREKKQKAKEEVQPELKKKKKKNQRDKKIEPSGSGSTTLGQVGRFKNGMLVLSAKEIQKIKGKKGVK